MKYIKTYEASIFDNDNTFNTEEDIYYIAHKQGSWSGDAAERYVKEVIEYYKMTPEQINNLRLALEYNYLKFDDFRSILGLIINSDKDNRVWTYFDSEKKLKIAFKTNFKTKIINIQKPYPIGYLTWNRYKWNIKHYNDLEGFDFSDIIGEIPKEYPFSKKYIVGNGRYRSENRNKRMTTLWEDYKNTKRESEFIKVVDENEIYILTPEDIKQCELIKNADKYNI